MSGQTLAAALALALTAGAAAAQQVPVPSGGLTTPNAALDQQSLCGASPQKAFPAQWTWSSAFTANPRDALPSDNLTPRIVQHRKINGVDTVVATWKSFSSNPYTCQEIFRYSPITPAPSPPYTAAAIDPYTPAQLQQMANTGCGPFGNVSHVDLFRMWLPGDVFVVYPAVYTGTTYNGQAVSNNNITLHPQADYWGSTGNPIYPPNDIMIEGVTENGVRPVIVRNDGGAGDSETYKDVIEIQGGANVTIENIAVSLGSSKGANVAQAGIYLIGAGYNTYDANGNSLAVPVLGPAPNVTLLTHLHVHGFQGGTWGADGIFGDANGGGEVEIVGSEIDHNGSYAVQGSADLAHGVYLDASQGSAAHDPSFTAVFLGNWFHDQVYGHDAKSRAQRTTFSSNYFQGGLPQSGFPQAEAYNADVPNGGVLTAIDNIFVKNASGPASNGFSLTFGVEGVPNDGPGNAPRANSILVENNTFVALAQTYDGTHSIVPFFFFYPAQSPAQSGFPVKSTTVTANAFVGYCPTGNAVSDYRGTTQLVAGFSDLSQAFSFSGRWVAPTTKIVGNWAYAHQSSVVQRKLSSVGAED